MSVSQAKRLAVTEGARVATEAERQSYQSNGYDEYEFIAESSACAICKPLDGKIFKVKDMEPGLNASPIHPFCRCATAAHYSKSDEEYERPIRESAESVYGKESYMEQGQAINISPKKASNAFSVDRELVNSKAFHDKFEKLPFSKNVNEALYRSSLEILEHRDGTNVEDLYVLNARTGREVTKNIETQVGFRVGLSNAQYQKVLAEDEIIILHNHPEGGRLSIADIKSLFNTPNAKASVVVGHDGDMFMVHSPNRKVSVEEIYQKLYNKAVNEIQNSQMAERKATDKIYELGVFSYEKF